MDLRKKKVRRQNKQSWLNVTNIAAFFFLYCETFFFEIHSITAIGVGNDMWPMWLVHRAHYIASVEKKKMNLEMNPGNENMKHIVCKVCFCFINKATLQSTLSTKPGRQIRNTIAVSIFKCSRGSGTKGRDLQTWRNCCCPDNWRRGWRCCTLRTNPGTIGKHACGLLCTDCLDHQRCTQHQWQPR